jgi:hypothetical protein
MFRRHPIGDSFRSYADRGPSGHNTKGVDICGVAALPTAAPSTQGRQAVRPSPSAVMRSRSLSAGVVTQRLIALGGCIGG